MDLFRELDAEETREFEKWAEDNYTPGSRIPEIWHPAVKARCLEINLRAVDKSRTFAITMTEEQVKDLMDAMKGIARDLGETPPETAAEALWASQSIKVFSVTEIDFLTRKCD